MPVPKPTPLKSETPAQRPRGPVERPRVQRRWRPRPGKARSDALRWIVFFALHMPLVMAVKYSALIATAHALVTFAVGVACLRFRTPERLLCVMGYIVASEPLWRVGRALIFYESGKYAVAGLAILALLRFRLLPRTDKVPLIYIALLLPSILVLPEFDRRQISFNLSGPFALAMCTLFLSTQRISVRGLKTMILATLAPILGFAFVATFSTVTTENIDFYSSKVAAGGLGNNQASSILGLGLLLGFFYLFVDRRDRLLRAVAAAAALWCGAQAALTFSRGGVMTALGAVAAASFFLLRDRRARGALIVRVGLFALLASSVVVPQLDMITGGALTDRFSDTHLTGRDKIMKADLIAFRENPVFGVGPGGSKAYHARIFRWSSAHTEYSRLLAEHGLFGLAAMLLLGWLAVKRLGRSSPHVAKGIAVGFTVWALLFMFHASMRMAAASFFFALGAAYLMAAPRRALGAVPVVQRYRRSRSGPSSRRVSRAF